MKITRRPQLYDQLYDRIWHGTKLDQKIGLYKLAGSSAKRERLFDVEQHANLDAH